MKRGNSKKPRIKVSSAKGKGRAFQKWVCSKISELTGFPWGTAGSDAPIESRSMGACGCDVRLERAVRKVFPFSVECKRQESWSVHDWITQAKENEMTNTDWLLFCRRSHCDPIVIMDANRFFDLLKAKREQ
jgi:hypothetical protein